MANTPWQLWVVAIFCVAALTVMSVAARRTSAGSERRTLELALIDDGASIDRSLDPSVFATLQVQRDESGDFVQIDDMRFRVNEAETFGYSGRQWPNGVLSYILAPDVKADAFKRTQFEEACKLLTRGSGVGCFEVGGANPGVHYVYVMNHQTENYSYVGKVGGRQDLAIASWTSRIIIAHEIKHALGWQHEHQRPDRDKYIRINLGNVQAGKGHNFDLAPNASMWRGTYDFDSIMHYGPYAFTNDSNVPPIRKTIEALPEYKQFESQMGQRDHVSETDSKEVIAIYGAPETEWCGTMRKPRREPPKGCFLECYRTPDLAIGEWLMCGSCAGAVKCP